jgi:hypothetical protein
MLQKVEVVVYMKSTCTGSQQCPGAIPFLELGSSFGRKWPFCLLPPQYRSYAQHPSAWSWSSMLVLETSVHNHPGKPPFRATVYHILDPKAKIADDRGGC